jgi:tetratricopeptide (TPR) repeat protein
MIGLIQVGDQAMADRYAYIPLIGLFIALVWSACDWLNSHRQLYPPAIAVTAILLVGLVWQCRRQIWYWQNSVTLFSHALAVTSNNFHAEVNLGGALEKLGRRDEAIRHFYAAAAANPKYGLAYYDIGVNLQHARRWQEAAREYELAIQNSTDPDLLARAHNNLAVNLDQLGHTEEAESQYRQALKLNSAEFN